MTMRLTNRAALAAGAALLALAACAKKDGAASEKPAAESSGEATSGEAAPSAPAAMDYAANAAAAVADPGRPAEDRADDERRKPAAALEFMKVAPGEDVFEIEAGGGWYTELLSHGVGLEGSVVMQNPQGFLSFVGDKINARLAGERLANVRQSISNFDAFDAPDASMDLVTWVQGPHELFYKPESGSLGDPVKSYAEIFRITRPGGVFVVIDHSAQAGAPETTGNDLHRIDKAIVVRMAQDAGFKLDGESDFLANPEDPLTVSVFDPTIRGHTDQFALRFVKPN